MNKLYCDKCGKAVDYTGGKLDCWDKTFGDRLNGIIWSVEARGNYMNSKVDLCQKCKAEGLKLLVAEASRRLLITHEDAPGSTNDESPRG